MAEGIKMRVVLDPNQLGFFFRHGYLEVEMPIREEDCRLLASSLAEIIRLRLSYSTTKLSSLQLLFGGRDLWRESPTLGRMIRKGPISELVTSLWWPQGGVRLLYDQLISFTPLATEASDNSFFRSLHEGSFTLSRYSAFSDIIGGLALCLECKEIEDMQEVDEENKGKISSRFLSVKVSTITCFSEKCRICFPKAGQGGAAMWYLIVFGKERSRYILNEKDPHVYRPKRLGYFLNDTLTSDRHPFIHLPSLF